MSDEIIPTETPAEAIAEAPVETPAEAPAAPTDAQIAEALGVDVDYLTENKGKLKDLNKFYSELNRKSMELAAAQKAPAPAAQPEADDEEVELDERSRKALRKFVENEFGDVFNLVQSTTVDAVGAVIEDFSSKHGDADPTRISEVMDEYGLWTPVPSKLKQNMERAYKMVKSETVDVDELAAQKAQELFEKMLEEKGLTAADVVSVKKSPKVDNVDTKDWRNPDLTPQERYAILKAKESIK